MSGSEDPNENDEWRDLTEQRHASEAETREAERLERGDQAQRMAPEDEVERVERELGNDLPDGDQSPVDDVD
jgi:hypothetical protein